MMMVMIVTIIINSHLGWGELRTKITLINVEYSIYS